jgi:hypothetical protein
MTGNANGEHDTNVRGDAILVPLNVVVPVSDDFEADMILDPGAYTSTHDPMLLKEDFASVLVVEPTVTAFVADDGE